jgi:flagellar motility protein MotE (MotC chaperone)
MNNETKMPWNYDILNIISIASYLLSIQNLQSNQQQTSNDDLSKHLESQDRILQEQNEKYLKEIIEQNETIIKLLKGGK